MTKSDWLTAAMIAAIIISAIATLTAPVLGIYLQSRISQQNPRPDAEHPPNPLQRLWRYLEPKVYWPFFVFMLFALTAFAFGFFRAKHSLDRLAVTAIAFGMAFYLTSGVSFAMLKALEPVWRKKKRPQKRTTTV